MQLLLTWLVAGLSLLVASLGLLLLLAAERIPPNPLFGARPGYAYVSRRVWVRVNRVAGVALLLIGSSATLLDLLAGWYVAVFVLEGLLASLIVPVTLYAERLAERDLLSRGGGGGERGAVILRPPRAALAALVVGVAAVVFVVVASLILYPLLPSRIAVHFDLSGVPDRYASRGEWFAIVVPVSALLVIVTCGLGVLMVRKPLAFYKPWYTPGEYRLTVAAIASVISFVDILTSYALLDSLIYNIYGFHVAPVAFTVLATVLVLAVLLGVIVVVYSRATARWWRSRGVQAQGLL